MSWGGNNNNNNPWGNNSNNWNNSQKSKIDVDINDSIKNPSTNSNNSNNNRNGRNRRNNSNSSSNNNSNDGWFNVSNAKRQRSDPKPIDEFDVFIPKDGSILGKRTRSNNV